MVSVVCYIVAVGVDDVWISSLRYELKLISNYWSNYYVDEAVKQQDMALSKVLVDFRLIFAVVCILVFKALMTTHNIALSSILKQQSVA